MSADVNTDVKADAVNTCDYGHQTGREIRSLPTGHGNALLCRKHYETEMRFRRESEIDFDLPLWETLSVYSEAVE